MCFLNCLQSSRRSRREIPPPAHVKTYDITPECRRRSCAGLAEPGVRCAKIYVESRDTHHATDDLYRGPAADRPPQGAARLHRLCRSGLLCRTDAARQPRRSRAHQAAPAHSVRCQQSQHQDDDPRRACRAAAGAGADRALRHAARRRRDLGVPRRAGGGHSVHAVDDVDLLDRGCRGGRRQAVLVSALCHEGPRLHPRADRARGRGQMQRARADRRSPGHRPAPQRHQERHDRAAGASLEERDRHRHQAGLGARASCAASARPSAISPDTIPAWKASPCCRNGFPNSSTRR